MRAKYFSIYHLKVTFIYLLLFLLVFTFRPGSVIVYFILFFKTAMNPEKGIENLRVAIFANDTFGGLQAKDLVLQSEERTKSTTTTGIKGLGTLSINVRGLHVSSGSHSRPLSVFCSSFSRLAVFNQSSFSLLHLFATSFCCVLSLSFSHNFPERCCILLRQCLFNKPQRRFPNSIEK